MIQDIVISRAKNGWVVNVRTDRQVRMSDGRYEPEILTHVASTDRALVSEVKLILKEGAEVMARAMAMAAAPLLKEIGEPDGVERHWIESDERRKQPTCLMVDEPAEK